MKFHLDVGAFLFPISSCCAMLLSAQKCESQTVDSVSCLFIFYFNTPIFEIFKTLQKGLVRLLPKFICCLLKTKKTSHVLRKLQNSFAIFACRFFLCLSPTVLHLHGKVLHCVRATGVASVRSCQKLPTHSTESAGSKTDLALA